MTLARAVAAMAPLLPKPAVPLVGVQLLKLPLGGDERMTDTKLRTMTTDLARPPLPPDELVATFRRLCADPPAWLRGRGGEDAPTH